MKYRHNQQKQIGWSAAEKVAFIIPGILVIVLAVVLGISFGDSLENTHGHTGTIESANPPSIPKGPELVPDFDARSKQVNEAVRRHVDCLKLVTLGHKQGEALVKLLENNAHPVVVVSNRPGRFMFFHTTDRYPNFDTAFFVTMKLHGSNGSVANASFDPITKLLKLPYQSLTDVWCGAITGHEMSHVDDILSGREKPSPPWSDEWVAGEIKAHEFENELIDRWTGGEFTRALDRLAEKITQGSRLSDFTKNFHEVNALFPPAASQAEQEMRHGTYLIALSFLVVERRGGPDIFQEKIRAYREIATPH